MVPVDGALEARRRGRPTPRVATGAFRIAAFGEGLLNFGPYAQFTGTETTFPHRFQVSRGRI